MSTRIAILRPLRSSLVRQSALLLLSSSQLATQAQQQLQRNARTYSSESSKPPTGNFYKTFTRPVAKTFLLAIFTYQVIYWAWTKLEQDEVKVERQAEVERLEQQLKTLHEATVKAAETTASSSDAPTSGGDGKKKSWYQFW